MSGFSKYPDIEFFSHKICDIKYIHDINFSPEKKTLIKYKSKNINWNKYVDEFNETMKDRNIEEYIKSNYTYANVENICLMCSEEKSINCHRLLVCNYFKNIFGLNIVNL